MTEDTNPSSFTTQFASPRGFRQAFVQEGVGGIPVLLVHGWPETKRIWWRNIAELAAAGFEVVAPDLRGFGETAPAPASAKPGYFGNSYRESFLSLHLNRPLLGQRTFDVLAVLEALAGEETQGFHLIGVGSAGPLALHAAALDTRVKQTTLEQSLASWADVVRTPVSYDQLTNVVPGVLRVYDLPELAKVVAPRGLVIRDSRDAAQKPAK